VIGRGDVFAILEQQPSRALDHAPRGADALLIRSRRAGDLIRLVDAHPVDHFARVLGDDVKTSYTMTACGHCARISSP
jgi:hypothetical protein